MKSLSLMFAAAVVVGSNVLVLVHAARNRAGNPEAEITLTQRELEYPRSSDSDDDSEVTLLLRWRNPDAGWKSAPAENSPRWLDREKLTALGFDCSVDPTAGNAWRFYRRQRPRRAFIALEYDGDAWRAWQENHPGAGAAGVAGQDSHMVAVDLDLNAARLRARHPGRGTTAILPAVVAISLSGYLDPKADPDRKRPAEIVGHIREVPAGIHVPRPFSDAFRRSGRAQGALAYRVHLRYGNSLEPWVTGVEMTSSPLP
jgi:hypothetical protein